MNGSKPEDRDFYKYVFTMLDKNNDETILTKELGTALQLLGRNPTESQIKEIVGLFIKVFFFHFNKIF